MENFNFDIFIGKEMVTNQSKSIAAVIEPKFFIPKGKYKLDGTLSLDSHMQCFKRLYDAATYIADWFDLVGDANLIQARIYLNKLSLYKSFKGKDIINCIDKINNIPYRFEIKSFDELI